MPETFEQFWQAVYDMMVAVHLWPAFPIAFGAMLIGGLVIYFLERIFGVGGGGDA